MCRVAVARGGTRIQIQALGGPSLRLPRVLLGRFCFGTSCTHVPLTVSPRLFCRFWWLSCPAYTGARGKHSGRQKQRPFRSGSDVLMLQGHMRWLCHKGSGIEYQLTKEGRCFCQAPSWCVHRARCHGDSSERWHIL